MVNLYQDLTKNKLVDTGKKYNNITGNKLVTEAAEKVKDFNYLKMNIYTNKIILH